MGSFLNFVEIIEYTATEDGKCLMKQDWSCKTHIGRYIDGWFESQFLGICRKNAQDGIKGMTQSYVTKNPYDPHKPKVDIFLNGGQFCIFFSKLVRGIDLILFFIVIYG